MACPRCPLYELEPDEPVFTPEQVGGFLLGFLGTGAGAALALWWWFRVP